MKKIILLFGSFVCILGMLGCAKGAKSCPEMESTPEVGVSDEAENFEENSNQSMISSDMVGQGIYDRLQEDWAAWDAKSEMEQMISSHMPGHCYASFNDWTECEEFLGFEVFNPLENSDYEKATYVGMPEGYNDAPRFYVSFYGTKEGKAEHIYVDSGYRDGDIRITVNAQIFVDTPKENVDDAKPLITEDSGERYVATTAVLVRGPVTYSIRVIGNPNMQTQVKETLEKVLPYFKEDSGR